MGDFGRYHKNEPQHRNPDPKSDHYEKSRLNKLEEPQFNNESDRKEDNTRHVERNLNLRYEEPRLNYAQLPLEKLNADLLTKASNVLQKKIESIDHDMSIATDKNKQKLEKKRSIYVQATS